MRFPCVTGTLSGVPGTSVAAVLAELIAGCSPSTTSTVAEELADVAEDADNVAVAGPRPIPAAASKVKVCVPTLRGRDQLSAEPDVGSVAATPSSMVLPGTYANEGGRLTETCAVVALLPTVMVAV